MTHGLIRRQFARLLRTALAFAVVCAGTAVCHATLYVIVLDNQGVVIASDSRKIWLAGQRITYADGVEKVIPLGTKLAFISSGMTEVSVASSTIRPAQIVRICYASLVRNSSLFSMKELADFFAKRTTDPLNSLSDSEKAAVALLARRFGSQNGAKS